MVADDRDVTVLTLEASTSDARIADELGWRHRSIEPIAGFRRRWTSADLALLADLVRSEADESTIVVPYSADPTIHRVLATSGSTVASIEPSLRARLDDRSWVRSSLEAAAVDVVPHRRLCETTFDQLRAELGLPLVVQSSPSSSGAGTWFVHTEESFARAKVRAGGRGIVSPYRGDQVLNMHVLVDGAGKVSTSPVSRQLTGVQGLVHRRAAYCGNDFASALAPALQRCAEVAATSVGAWLATLGYLGLAGIDLLAWGDECAVLEVNPRLQASTWMIPGSPFVGRHIACWDPDLVPRGVLRRPGSQLLLTQGESDPSGPLPLSGTYLVGDGSLAFLGPEVDPNACPDDGVVVLGVPVPDISVVAGAVVARIVAPRSLSGSDSRHLDERGALIVGCLRRGAVEGLPVTRG